MAQDLPDGWKWLRLEEAAQIVFGQSPPSNTYNDSRHGLPFFQGKSEFTQLYPVVRKWCSSPLRIAKPNDLLLSVRAPIGSINIANSECCIGRGLAALRFKGNYKYLFYYLQLQASLLDLLGTGTTFRAITSQTLRNFPIPFAPLKFQNAIVDRIETFINNIDQGIEHIERVKSELSIYRQAILKYAFEGKLTLDRIDEGCHSSTIKLGNLLESVKYGTSKKCISTKIGIPVLRIPNVVAGNISTQDLKYAEFTTEEVEALSIKDGDILVIRSNGSLSIVGTAARITKNTAGYLYAGYLIRLRLKKDIADPDYVNYLFQSEIIRSQIESLSKSTSGVNNVNAKELENLQIPLFPLEVQKSIVSEIKQRFTQADNLLQLIETEILNAEILKQSILKQAFNGSLLTMPIKRKNTFTQIQILGYMIKRYSEKPKPVNLGEMGWAKHVYIADKLFNVSTGFNFQNWHYGPYDPEMKTLINTRKYFKKIGTAGSQVVKLINADTLLKYNNSEFEKLDEAIDELYEIFAKYPAKERSEKAELLATVCKCIEDTQSIDLGTIRTAMTDWKIKVNGKPYTNKAEKFTVAETSKCLQFIIQKEWDKKLI